MDPGRAHGGLTPTRERPNGHTMYRKIAKRKHAIRVMPLGVYRTCTAKARSPRGGQPHCGPDTHALPRAAGARRRESQ